MLRLSKGMAWLLLGVASIEAYADEMNNVYPQSQEVAIPGYTPPAASSPESNTAPAPGPSSNPQPNSAPFSVPLTPEQIHKSCTKFIAIKVPFEEIRNNFKNGFDETTTGNIYQWTREGEPNLVITFLDNNTPTSVTGNLPSNIPNGKDLNFSLTDVQKALSTPGVIIGHVHVFTQSKGEGEIYIYTDSKDVVTSYTTTAVCKESML